MTLKVPQKGSKFIPNDAKVLLSGPKGAQVTAKVTPKGSKRDPKISQRHPKYTQYDFCEFLTCPKSAYAMPVQRILDHNEHMRCLCSGFEFKKPNFHEKVSICDACAADLA